MNAIKRLNSVKSQHLAWTTSPLERIVSNLETSFRTFTQALSPVWRLFHFCFYFFLNENNQCRVIGNSVFMVSDIKTRVSVKCWKKLWNWLKYWHWFTNLWDTSAGTGKLCILGHLGLVFIWSCFVFCLLFLLFYVSLRNLCSGTCRKIQSLSLQYCVWYFKSII